MALPGPGETIASFVSFLHILGFHNFSDCCARSDRVRIGWRASFSFPGSDLEAPGCRRRRRCRAWTRVFGNLCFHFLLDCGVWHILPSKCAMNLWCNCNAIMLSLLFSILLVASLGTWSVVEQSRYFNCDAAMGHCNCFDCGASVDRGTVAMSHCVSGQLPRRTRIEPHLASGLRRVMDGWDGHCFVIRRAVVGAGL